MKQLLRLIGGLILLAVALAMPSITCYQKRTTHQEKDAVITEVKSYQTEGRRRRLSTHYKLHYAYEVGEAKYKGYDSKYEADGDAKPGDPIRIIYNKTNPQESRISEGGGQNWLQTLVLLAIAGFLFFQFYRNRG
ncbi:MAG TPA: DUF3592 domain-containing protein [Saprospiraceae bacterium]|nr:DUF3592 domain-containing protein [Saprospiraceae bacterium]